MTTIWLIEQDAKGMRTVCDVVQPLPHNAGMWARRMRGLAKSMANTNPDCTYHLMDGNRREFFRASI